MGRAIPLLPLWAVRPVQSLSACTRGALYTSPYSNLSRSQWPRGLWRGSAAARLLGLGFESLRSNGCLSVVSVMCCQVEVPSSGWSLVQRNPTECEVCEWGLWMSVCCECCVLSGRGPFLGLITRPEESYRVWCVSEWSRILDNEEAMAHLELSRHGKIKLLK